MAGANVVLKKGQQLFKEGDKSDGMYIIRKGEITVYLEKSGSEVKLATMAAGAMLGEMTLFDNKPRSASAKATQDSEITRISTEDFAKLMKQIPKWFVTLMASLSSRLRETNERLQKVEARVNGASNPLTNAVKAMGVLNLVWHKDGTKDGKDWVMDREKAEAEVARILEIEQESLNKIVTSFSEGRLIQIKKDNYKKDILFIANRGNLEKFCNFAQQFRKDFPDKKNVPQEMVDMLECINKLAQESAYDSVTVPLEELYEEGERKAMTTTGWEATLEFFKKPNETISLVKISVDKVGFKVDKQKLPRLVESYKSLRALFNGVT